MFAATFLRNVEAPVEFFWSGEPLRGDVNGDGAVNILDLTLLRLFLAERATEILLANADFNGDSRISSEDANALRRHLVA